MCRRYTYTCSVHIWEGDDWKVRVGNIQLISCLFFNSIAYSVHGRNDSYMVYVCFFFFSCVYMWYICASTRSATIYRFFTFGIRTRKHSTHILLGSESFEERLFRFLFYSFHFFPSIICMLSCVYENAACMRYVVGKYHLSTHIAI